MRAIGMEGTRLANEVRFVRIYIYIYTPYMYMLIQFSISDQTNIQHCAWSTSCLYLVSKSFIRVCFARSWYIRRNKRKSVVIREGGGGICSNVNNFALLCVLLSGLSSSIIAPFGAIYIHSAVFTSILCFRLALNFSLCALNVVIR